MRPDLPSGIVAALRCGVVAVDSNGQVTVVNPLAEEALAVPPDRWRGRDCREVFSHCLPFASVLLDALSRDTLPDRAELDLAVGSSRRILLGFSLSRLVGEGGQVEGSVIFFKDLTVVEEERERQALRNRLAALGEVAAQLAHELRNRLGGVRLFVGLARRRIGDDDQAVGYLDRAEQELVGANDKMTQVLDFVRPLKLDLRRVDVAPLCRAAAEITLSRFPAAKVEVHWAADSQVPPVLADELLLRDALSNLIANAVECGAGCLRVCIGRDEAHAPMVTAGGGAIPGLKVWDRAEGARVRIGISDDGPGMTPEVLRRIFQPFFTTKEEGSGLGVPAAQKILAAHGGSLDVRSSAGAGTEFTLLIPAASEEDGHG